MAQRVQPVDVHAIIDSDITIDMQPFILPATALTDYVVTKDTASILTTSLTKQIEAYLSAHFYAHRDQQFRDQKTGDAGASFQVGVEGDGLATTQWGKSAIALDITGTLKSISKGATPVGLTWLGKPPSEQLKYSARD